MASITTPSSNELSYSLELAADDRLTPVTVDRSSAAAGAARRSAVASASFSSSRVTFTFRCTLFRVVTRVLRRLRAGPPKRTLIRCIPVVVEVVGFEVGFEVWFEVGFDVGFDVWSWAPAARSPKLSSRAQSSMQAAGTMGLGGLGREVGPGAYFLSLPSTLHQPSRSRGPVNRPRGCSKARATPRPSPKCSSRAGPAAPRAELKNHEELW